MVQLTQASDQDGVRQYDFELVVEDERVPAALWAPSEARGPRPLVLMGHGATQHKKIDAIAARARHYARDYGYATLAIDALGHGGRVVGDANEMARSVAARVTGASSEPSPIFKTMRERVRRIVPEWKAALDAVQALDFIGAGQPVGYWGLSMGAVTGVPFVASEPRVTCAIFGLGGARPKDEAFVAQCRAITVPVEFTFQWDDAIASREAGLAMFEALGAREKSMHINPGGHGEIPAFENASWDAFFRRHLGEVAS